MRRGGAGFGDARRRSPCFKLRARPKWRDALQRESHMADIFVSYTSSDKDWAEWIGHELIRLGYEPHLHDWEISGGGDLMAWMEQRHHDADHVLGVVSKSYLDKPYSSLERRAAQWAAVTDRPNFVLPVFVEDCAPRTLLAILKRCELFGVGEETARARLEAFLKPAQRSVAQPSFPGRAAKSEATPSAAPAFPGKPLAQSNITISVPEHFLGRDADMAARLLDTEKDAPTIERSPPSNQEALRLPEKITFRWMIDHVPISWWWYFSTGLIALVGGTFWVAHLSILQQVPQLPATLRQSEAASDDASKAPALEAALRVAISGREATQRDLVEAQKLISDLRSAHAQSLPLDAAKISDLTGQVSSLKNQLEQARSSYKLLLSLSELFPQITAQYLDISSTARRLNDEERAKNPAMRHRILDFPPPICRFIMVTTKENRNFANEIESITRSRGCEVKYVDAPPPTPRPTNADLPPPPPIVLPEPASYVTVRYPHPEDIGNLQGVETPVVRFPELIDKVAQSYDQIADRLTAALQKCGLDARRSHKVEGALGWPLDKWAVYIDLGKAQMCH